MSKKALEDQRYELIKAHVLDPSNSKLPEEHQEILDRVISIAKVLDRQPIQKHAVAIHMFKYKEISRSQAYEDCRLAMRLFNTMYTFDYDFWHMWLINDIAKNIERANRLGSPASLKVVAMEHANLIRALGERPTEGINPKLVEQHNFYIPIVINNKTVNIDLMKLIALPQESRQGLVESLFTEISAEDAEEIMKT